MARSIKLLCEYWNHSANRFSSIICLKPDRFRSALNVQNILIDSFNVRFLMLSEVGALVTNHIQKQVPGLRFLSTIEIEQNKALVSIDRTKSPCEKSEPRESS